MGSMFHSGWIIGLMDPPSDSLPLTFRVPALREKKKKKNVGCARADGRCAWVRAITGALTMQTIIEYQLIWASLENFCLNSEDFFFRKRA